MKMMTVWLIGVFFLMSGSLAGAEVERSAAAQRVHERRLERKQKESASDETAGKKDATKEEMWQVLFKELDMDQDGVVSKREYWAGQREISVFKKGSKEGGEKLEEAIKQSRTSMGDSTRSKWKMKKKIVTPKKDAKE